MRGNYDYEIKVDGDGRGICTLHVYTRDGVIWIIGGDIVGAGSSADIIMLCWVRGIPNQILVLGGRRGRNGVLHGITIIVM